MVRCKSREVTECPNFRPIPNTVLVTKTQMILTLIHALASQDIAAQSYQCPAISCNYGACSYTVLEWQKENCFDKKCEETISQRQVHSSCQRYVSTEFNLSCSFKSPQWEKFMNSPSCFLRLITMRTNRWLRDFNDYRMRVAPVTIAQKFLRIRQLAAFYYMFT